MKFIPRLLLPLSLVCLGLLLPAVVHTVILKQAAATAATS